MKFFKRFLPLFLLSALLLSVGSVSGFAEDAPLPYGVSFSERDDSAFGDYTDSVGNFYQYTYSLPVVSGDSDYVKAVNAELNEVFNTYIAPDLLHMESGSSLVTTYVSWRTAVYKDITSLIVALHNAWDNSEYYVYSFTPEGEQATKEDLFSALGISGDEFTAAASQILAEQLVIDDPDARTEEILAVLEECREKTLAPENCNDELPIFLTGNGTVCFVGRIYTPAGAGYYDHLFIIPPEDGFLAEELAEFARDYYGMRFGHRPEHAASELNEDGTVTVQLFDLIDDHNSTCAWYTISPSDGTGMDSLGNLVDLTIQ